jgi:methionyl-tRNA formyltransferase
MRFVLVGAESAGLRALRLLHRGPHDVAFVMTRDESMKRLAASLGVPVHDSKLVKDASTATMLRDHRVDVLLNVYSMFQVCAEVIEAPRVAAFNLHPGLLPHVAGRNPISAALYHGHDVHGITLHYMTVEFDAGAIAFQERIPVTTDDNALTLSTKCVAAGERLVGALLEAATTGTLPSIEQDLSLRTYYGPEMPNGGSVDWTTSGRRVVDFVRAYDFLPFTSRWGHPRSAVGSRVIEIARARRTDRACDARPGTVGLVTDGGAEVATADTWVKVERVRVDGTYEDAAASLRPGDVLTPPSVEDAK